MGCEQSDVMPFINAITNDQDQNQHSRPQQRPPQQQAYAQPQHPQYSQSPQMYQQNPPQQQYYQQQGQPQAQGYYPQQPIQNVNYQQPPQQMVVPSNTKEIKVSGMAKRSKPRPQRQVLEFAVNFDDDFLTHHLKYELSLSKLTSMKRIRRRQILEHQYLKVMWGNFQGYKDLDISFDAYRESMVAAWMQRTFLDIWEQAHDDLFVKHLEQKEVRRKVSEQYMFELYELKQYVDSGMASFSFILPKSQLQLFSLVQASDDALFNIFKKLKDRYPQTGGAGQNIQFPDVPSTKTNMDLLNNFNKLSFSDPANLNYQTIYEDINFLLKRAIEEKDTFKTDMQQILGSDVLACPKVNEVEKDGKKSFNACAVRRVFVKWAQNLLEKCPDLVCTKTFMKYVKSRSDIVNNFIFKSTITSTTHKIVIDCISLLVEVAKYGLTDKKKRDEFIFNIYDLLRCKIKRKTPTEIVDLLKRMQSTSVTKSGKKFEVIRVKNRFKTNNRDLLINFRYGDVLVGEAQLCIDSASMNKQTKLNYQFCHYIYELERSLFGPTLQLMMQYQDFQRPDITVSFEAEDIVYPRENQIIKNSGTINRKCLQGHDMITIVGNFFEPKQTPEQTDEQTINKAVSMSCQYCDRPTNLQQPYDYCYHCGCLLCSACREQYKKVDYKKFWLSIQRQDLLPTVNNLNQVKNLCAQNKSIIILFWLEQSSASTIWKDSIIFQQGKLLMQPGKYIPKVYQAKYNNSSSFKDMCNKYNITQFPTLILLEQQAQVYRTVVGISWFDTPILYHSQKRLVEGKNLDLDMYCLTCEKKMQAKQMEQQMFCACCFNQNKLINMPDELLKYGVFCQEGHYRCISCCYAAMDCATTYKDTLGSSYLASTFTTPKLPKCPKGHQTSLSKTTPTQSWIFKCFKCNKDKFFNNEHGTGQCGQCKSYVCAQCLGAKLPTFKQLENSNDLVDHFVESTAEQACVCICTRHFKKAYTGRYLEFEQLLEGKGRTWKCMFCQKDGQNGQLHIACFNCPILKHYHGKKVNLQLCINCASKAKILLREPQQKAVEQPTLFMCPKDRNPLVMTSCNYNKQLIVSCDFCKKNYFSYTQRLHCKTCKLNCCKGCRKNIIQKGLVPKCSQRCPKGHALPFKIMEETGFQICDGCMSISRESGFKCQADNYSLCTTCAMTQPAHFIGKGINSGFRGEEGYEGYDDAEQYYKNQTNDYGAIFQGYEKPEQGEYGFDDFINDVFS